MGAHRLGQDEQYLTVREILSETSTLADGTLSRELSDFYPFGYAPLGSTLGTHKSLHFAHLRFFDIRAWPSVRCAVICSNRRISDFRLLSGMLNLKSWACWDWEAVYHFQDPSEIFLDSDYLS